MASYDEEIRDTWEEAGRLNIPAVSFADRRKGDGFRAVVLPTPDNVRKFGGKGYQQVPDMEPRAIKDPAGGTTPIRNPNFGKPRRWGDGNLILKTMLRLSLIEGIERADDFMSDRMVKSIQAAVGEADPDDLKFIEIMKRFGLRRFYADGPSLQPEFLEAVKAKGKAPQVGARLEVRIKDLEPNPHGGKTKIYEVTYDLPDADSMKVVEQWREVAGWVTNFLPEPGEDHHQAPPDADEQRRQGGDVPPNMGAVRPEPDRAPRTEDDSPPF